MMEQDCMDVAQSLRHNATLRAISMDDGNRVEVCGAVLLDSLQQHNTTLQSVLDRMPAFLARCSKASDLATKTSWNQALHGKHFVIGSPGVGKLVIFFLMILIKARSTPIVYFRKARKAFCSV